MALEIVCRLVGNTRWASKEPRAGHIGIDTCAGETALLDGEDGGLPEFRSRRGHYRVGYHLVEGSDGRNFFSSSL